VTGRSAHGGGCHGSSCRRSPQPADHARAWCPKDQAAGLLRQELPVLPLLLYVRPPLLSLFTAAEFLLGTRSDEPSVSCDHHTVVVFVLLFPHGLCTVVEQQTSVLEVAASNERCGLWSSWLRLDTSTPPHPPWTTRPPPLAHHTPIQPPFHLCPTSSENAAITTARLL
jgi:hypothetical protein